MTAAFEFYAERAFLGYVRRTIIDDRDFEIEDGAVSLIACAAAFEGMINRMLEGIGKFKQEKDSSIRNKVIYIAVMANTPIDWDNHPWADINTLIDHRNWLIHYKESWSGLVNSDGKWIQDGKHDVSLNPMRALCKARIKEHYQTVLKTILQLSDDLGLHDEFKYLESENFESFIQTG